MGFSNEWEQQYASSNHLSRWPWSDLVSYVMRYARPTGSDFKVLEVGCGAGANIPFFLSLDANYTAVDGSASTINNLKQAYPELQDALHVMDFSKELPAGKFDLIIDRGAITHNDTQGITSTISNIYEALTEQGKFIGIDWFSTRYSDFSNPEACIEQVDEWTRTFNSKSRSFANLGNVHFSDKAHLETLFSDFTLSHMQHKIIEDGTGWELASYNFVADKK